MHLFYGIFFLIVIVVFIVFVLCFSFKVQHTPICHLWCHAFRINLIIVIIDDRPLMWMLVIFEAFVL